jgi:hypothetical protein
VWTSVLSILGGAIALARAIWNRFYSDTAWRRQREIADAERVGREAVERERLESTYGRIDREPDQTGQDLADDLNRKRS